MLRRRLTVIAVLLAAVSIAACSSPTAPQPSQQCQVVNGVNTCPDGGG